MLIPCVSMVANHRAFVSRRLTLRLLSSKKESRYPQSGYKIREINRLVSHRLHPPAPVVSVMSVKSESRSIKKVNRPDSQPAILATEDLLDEGFVDPVYQAKARVLNRALQEIGMGKYQVHILCLPPFHLEHWRDCFASVGTIRRRRFWMVFVSEGGVLFLLKSFFTSVCFLRFSDSVWPVRFRFGSTFPYARSDRQPT